MNLRFVSLGCIAALFTELAAGGSRDATMPDHPHLPEELGTPAVVVSPTAWLSPSGSTAAFGSGYPYNPWTSDWTQ